MKKLFAVLLAVAMLLSLGVTALADDESITVVNAPSGVIYRAFKVFEVTQNTDDTLTYTTVPEWNSTLMWTSPVAQSADDYDDYVAQWELANGETYDATKDKTSVNNPLSKMQADKISYIGSGPAYEVVTKTGFSSSDFAKALNEAFVDTDTAPFDVSTPSEDVTNNPDAKVMKVDETGYYLILAAKASNYEVKEDTLTPAQWAALSDAQKAMYVPNDPASPTEYTFNGPTPISADDYNALPDSKDDPKALYVAEYTLKGDVATTLTPDQYAALSTPAEKALYAPDKEPTVYTFNGASTLTATQYTALTPDTLQGLYEISQYVVKKATMTAAEWDDLPLEAQGLYTGDGSDPETYTFNGTTPLTVTQYSNITSDVVKGLYEPVYVVTNSTLTPEAWAALTDADQQAKYTPDRTPTVYTLTLTSPIDQDAFDDLGATAKGKYEVGYNAVKTTLTSDEYDALPDGQKSYYAFDAASGKYTIKNGTLSETDYKNLPATGVKELYQPSDKFLKPIEEKAMMTTVLEGKNVQIQNKNDMPLDKEVDTDGDGEYDDNLSGVQVGDVLNYKITAKIPELGDNISSYIYQFTDEMTAGLTPNNKLTIKILNEGEKESGEGDVNVANTIVLEPQDEYTLKNQASVPFTNKTYDPTYELMGNTVRFGKNGYAWELSLDVISTDDGSFKPYAGRFIEICYTATVNAEAVCEVIENHAVLAYGPDSNHLTVKDAETKNYLSKILIDKYESGSPTQKLEGAEFALYKAEVVPGTLDAYGQPTYTIKYYSLHADQYVNAAGKIIGKTEFDSLNATAQAAYTLKSDAVIPWAIWKEVDGEPVLQATDEDGEIKGQFGKDDVKVVWVAITDPTKEADQALITRVRTGEDGAAQFGYLADSAKYLFSENEDNTDNAYYLVETKAPVDYTRLLDPIKVEIDGSAATAPNMTRQQQQTILTEIVNVDNTPGSTLPSTGGVGATMMTIGGVALILAAGAFLVLRRRKEQE